LLTRNILLGLGFFALLAGVMLVFMWFHQPEISSAPIVVQIPTKKILVASHAIPGGALLRKSDMAWGELPAAEVVGSDIVYGDLAETELIGAVTRRAFSTREPLTSFALVKPGDRDFLVAALAPGFRAVSISVDATQSTSGLALPGDRVDILLTQSFQAPGTDASHRSVGETVLRDLRVVAVDQALTPVLAPTSLLSATVELKMPKTITLEVTDRQAAILLVAEQLGKIQIALRGQQDQHATASMEASDTSPIWASDVSPALGGSAAAPTTPGFGPIEVIHGAKIERRCETSAGLLTCP
jgi:pilus assembly protein CpaB